MITKKRQEEIEKEIDKAIDSIEEDEDDLIDEHGEGGWTEDN